MSDADKMADGLELAPRAAGLDARAQTILKALVVGGDAADAASIPNGDEREFAEAGALVPPYDPAALCRLFEHSNSLRQSVDAYGTNIDAFGHRLEPAIDLAAPDAATKVAEAMVLERLAADEAAGGAGAPAEPTADEVAARTKELAQIARVERARLDAFFEFACFDHSFVHLRRRSRQDLEVTGNAYWEVLRDGAGRVARLVYVPSYTMRLLPLDREPTDVTERVRVSPVTLEAVEVRVRFRRFVQMQGIVRVFFKSFGDPRVLSRNTGEVRASTEELARRGGGDAPATEILHFAIPSPRSAYGVPRWIGTLLAVLGSRESEEVNYSYFANKSVPPLALLVSGGKLSPECVPRIERFIEENLKGKNNWHKILILEADGGGTGAATDATRARIELRPLTEAQQQDALFQAYDQRNSDKVGASFRLPRLLRGESTDFNRSVADAQLRFAEDQVFQPERDEFDFIMNRRLLADMGIRFWRFRSQTPVTRDPERMTAMVEKLVRVGVLTPAEGRVLASDIFNREFAKIDQDWLQRPLVLTLAGIQTGAADVQQKQASLLDDARRLVTLREELEQEETRLAERRMELARRYLADGDAERVGVPAEEFASWLAPQESDG